MLLLQTLLLVAPLAAPTVQETRAIFDAPVIVADELQRLQLLLDLDGDGDTDALSWWWTSSGQTAVRLQGFLNDGNGQLTATWSSTHAVDPPNLPGVDFARGDLNGDSLDDFALYIGRTIHVFHSNGASAPTKTETYQMPAPGEIELADFNGDGLDDAATLTDLRVLTILLNQGAVGGHDLVVASTQTLLSGRILAVGELSGDGIPDVLALHQGSQATGARIYPVFADGSVGSFIGSFGLGAYLSPPFPNIADIDGDGDLDVVVFDGSTFGPHEYKVLRRTGPSTFDNEPPAIGGPAYSLADIDGDGDPDGICCSTNSGGNWTNQYSSTFHIAMNDGTGAFGPAWTMPGLGSGHIAGADDLDGDGDVELIAGRTIYYGQGAITGPPHSPTGDEDVHERRIHDIESDGDPDLGVGLGPYWRNDATGAVELTSNPVDAPGNGNLKGPGYPGDFNGDGFVDLVVSLFQGGSFSRMRFLANDGAGGFFDDGPASDPGVSFNWSDDSDPRPRDSVTADLDLDGDLDLITRVTGPEPTQSRVWLNNGSGRFAGGDELPTYIVMGVGDLTGDTLPDLVVGVGLPRGTGFEGPLGFLAGVGGGSFSDVLQVIAPEVAPFSDTIALADLDADGDLDVAAVDNGNATVFVNDGTGACIASDTGVNASGSFGVGMHAADLNDDGLLDLLVSIRREDSIGVLLRRADNTGYEPVIQQSFQVDELVDLDGDGDFDALDEEGDRWFAGRRYEGPSAGRRRQYGDGSPGTGGIVPVLGAVGPFRVGETIEVRIVGGVGGALTQLTIGFAESAVADSPFAGMTAYNDPWFRRLPFTLSGPAGAPGAGHFTLVTEVVPAIAGTSFFHQAYVLDPGAPNGLSSSGGLELRYE